MGTAICSKRFFLRGGLLTSPRRASLDLNYYLHVSQGRSYSSRLHAHGMGAYSFCARYTDAAIMHTRAYSPHVYRGGLHAS